MLIGKPEITGTLLGHFWGTETETRVGRMMGQFGTCSKLDMTTYKTDIAALNSVILHRGNWEKTAASPPAVYAHFLGAKNVRVSLTVIVLSLNYRVNYCGIVMVINSDGEI